MAKKKDFWKLIGALMVITSFLNWVDNTEIRISTTALLWIIAIIIIFRKKLEGLLKKWDFSIR